MTASAFPRFPLHLEAKEKPGLMELAAPPSLLPVSAIGALRHRCLRGGRNRIFILR